MIRYIRQLIAIRRLNRLVAQRKASFEVQQYRRKRNAALKRTPRVWGI